jgi:transposase
MNSKEENRMKPTLPYTTQDLGHLGLVAGMCSELQIAESIDRLLPPTEKQISHGTAVCAMVLNGLGFVNQRLYLVPEFFRNKPVDRLLGEGMTAEQLNDDTLGRTLDAIYAANPTEVYAAVAATSCQRLGLQPRAGHLDSTSFHVDGRYNSEQPPEEGVIWITKGYSRDHRPELNQCILNLIVESQASIPIHMTAASGNSDDKTGFREQVTTHVEALQNVHGFTYVVTDSALYVEKTLKALAESLLFITRIPETLNLAKELLSRVERSLMHQIDENYCYQEVCGVYGGVKQRWIIVASQQAYERDLQALNRRALKQSEREQKAFAKLCRRAFACREDAMRAWEKFQKKTLRYTTVPDLAIREQAHYGRRGKPKKGAQPDRVEYFLMGAVASCLQTRAELERIQGMFILATNELDAERLPAPDVLQEYKGQSHVEKGFRFLKHPEFLASSLFLKKPERIMALLMIMTVCLMVYAALEYRIRQGLQQQGKTVLNQSGKPTNRPTARWIFHCFVGIHILFQEGRCVGIVNLEERHWNIITLLGYQAYYT